MWVWSSERRRDDSAWVSQLSKARISLLRDWLLIYIVSVSGLVFIPILVIWNERMILYVVNMEVNIYVTIATWLQREKGERNDVKAQKEMQICILIKSNIIFINLFSILYWTSEKQFSALYGFSFRASKKRSCMMNLCGLWITLCSCLDSAPKWYFFFFFFIFSMSLKDHDIYRLENDPISNNFQFRSTSQWHGHNLLIYLVYV